MIKIDRGSKVALVALSNALPIQMKEKIEDLSNVLMKMDLEPVCSQYLYQKESVRGAQAKVKARELEAFYEDEAIKAVFDVSGGDIANEVLCELNFEKLKDRKKCFWGYSDLTTIINALYQVTGETTCLYQVRNLIGIESVMQSQLFEESILGNEESLFQFEYRFLQGELMEGIVVGGNIRCFLKLAGTPFMPDFTDKILLLESRSGTMAQMITFLSQYKQLGAFKKVKGILLGSFTQMEEEGLVPTIEDLVIELVDNPDLPIAKTEEIGHGADSKAIQIGKTLRLCQ